MKINKTKIHQREEKKRLVCIIILTTLLFILIILSLFHHLYIDVVWNLYNFRKYFKFKFFKLNA